jgi:uncharacterized protein with PQ loop repeat
MLVSKLYGLCIKNEQIRIFDLRYLPVNQLNWISAFFWYVLRLNHLYV